MSREGSRSSFDTVRELARALPNVEEGGAPGPPALKVKGKLLAWLRDDPEILAVKVSPVNREYLLQVDPAIFFITDHYREYPIVLIRLSRIGRRQLAEVLEEAWRQVAPKRMRAAYDAERRVSVDWAGVQQELMKMAHEDLSVRAELAADGSLYLGYHPRMRAVHDRHAARLAQIVKSHGWPGEPQVGPEGAQAAWLIAQHAIAQPAFQREALSALSAAARRGEVPAWHVALLEDRIRTFEGLQQRYGTQFDWDASGQLSPLPIEDPLRVNELRQAVGLQPLAQEIQARREAAARDAERPPADWEAREKDREAWLREVGWRS